MSLGRAIIFAVLRQSGKLALRFWKLKLTAAGKAKVGPEIAGLSYCSAVFTSEGDGLRSRECGTFASGKVGIVYHTAMLTERRYINT